jgi:hypothetical protein
MEPLQQLVATLDNGFGLFFAASAPIRFAIDCHQVATTRLHKGSILSRLL